MQVLHEMMYSQVRNEGGGRGDTIPFPRASNHYGGAKSLRGRRKVPKLSQVLFSIQ